MGSRTARHSGLSGSFCPVEIAACSPYTCGATGISAARYLSPPSSVFITSRRIQMVQCALGKQRAREPKPTGTALPGKGWPLAGVTGCLACVSPRVRGKCTSTYLMRARCLEPTARALPWQRADVVLAGCFQ